MLDGSENDMVYEEIDKLLEELENENIVFLIECYNR